MRYWHFNSIKVQLEHRKLQCNSEGLQNFNSIKVQLELAICLLCETFTSFQFHKGTIRTEKPGSEPEARIKFQFHKGTIRTLDAYGVENPYSIISIP